MTSEINSSVTPITLTNIKRLNNQLNTNGEMLELNLSQEEYDSLKKSKLNYIYRKYSIIRCNLRLNDILNFKIVKNLNIPNLRIFYEDCEYPEKNLQAVVEISKEIRKLISGIDTQDSDFNKFSIIYRKIAEQITYDTNTAKLINESRNKKEPVELSNEQKKDVINSQNLGSLITKKTLCSGYSRILRAALNSVGIECKCIFGETDSQIDKKHAWNQVKIDGKWYNVDLTWDRDEIIKGNTPSNCLKSDYEFGKKHNKNSNINDFEICKEDFPQDKIRNFFYIKPLQIEQKEMTVDEIINLIEELRSKSYKGLRIGIKEDTKDDKYNYTLIFGNIINKDVVKWSQAHIKMNIKDVLDFINRYSKKYQITENKKPFIESKEGVGLSIITKQLKEDLENIGIDMDKLLSPNKNMEYAKDIQEKSFNKSNNTSMQLVKYKTNIFKSISRFVRNNSSKFLEKVTNLISKKTDKKAIGSNMQLEDKMISKNNRSPWDLANWGIEKDRLGNINVSDSFRKENLKKEKVENKEEIEKN